MLYSLILIDIFINMNTESFEIRHIGPTKVEIDQMLKIINAKSIDDLIFSLKVVKHLKSNAIVLSRNKQTLGLGHGHTNRVDALYYAIKNMNKYFKKGAFVCASDGFFPFVDSINLLKRNKCNAIAQPSGSINDKVIISFSIKNKISLYFTKNRLFKH